MLLFVLVAASGCSTLRVESLGSPGADFSRSATFRILDEPADTQMVRFVSMGGPERGAITFVSAAEPMLNNSIIDEIVRNDVRRAFEIRGYTMRYEDADLDVAYFVQARERLDLEAFNSRNTYRRDCCYVDEYTEAVVVIDVRDPVTNELLWRGSGTMDASDDPNQYAKQVREAVNKIVARFPPARRLPASQ